MTATITMIKKRLANGRACDKCEQAQALLERKGVWDQIDEVIWADEGDAQSPGMVLAAQHQVNLAPFFIVTDGEEATIYTSALKLIRERLTAPAADNNPRSQPAIPADLSATAKALASASPQRIMQWGLERFGASCAIAFSGAEDVVLIDMAAKSGLDFSVFCLDTGRLHDETYAFIEQVREHYGLDLKVMSPRAEAVQALVNAKGLFSFRRDGHKECCGIRKVEPLRRALSGYRAWITGQRRDQSPSTRGDVPVLQHDPAFSGVDDGPLVKLNPLTHWTSKQVWDYIRVFEVPYNPLHERGYISIGCAPCTRPTRPGEHERAGRWWWEEATQRECGLHVAD